MAYVKASLIGGLVLISASLAYAGIEGWGWFLFVAVLLM